jgi:hypothetical protein
MANSVPTVMTVLDPREAQRVKDCQEFISKYDVKNATPGQQAYYRECTGLEESQIIITPQTALGFTIVLGLLITIVLYQMKKKK